MPKFAAVVLPDKKKMDILELIEARRKAMNISKRQLAAKADITEDYYGRIIANNSTGVAYSIVMRLAEAVGLSVLVYIKP